jgi:hypothetical protein
MLPLAALVLLGVLLPLALKRCTRLRGRSVRLSRP